MIRIGKIVIGRLDIAGGEFTYGQRIALGEILGDETRSEYQRLKDAFRELYGYSCRLLLPGRRVQAFARIVAGISEWVEKEQKLLCYEPTAAELAAGIRELSRRVGDLSTIKALAKAYSHDPDEVLCWDYAKVFGILYTDLEERKFEDKYSKVIHDRYSGRHKGGA